MRRIGTAVRQFGTLIRALGRVLAQIPDYSREAERLLQERRRAGSWPVRLA